MIIQNWSFLKNSKNLSQDNQQYSNNLISSRNGKYKIIIIEQNPSQLESSHESTIIFEQEFNKHEMAQNMIFDNIIAPNKFMQYNLNIQKKLE
ncbi:hypothetical protein TTHERM_001328931 (macronuclear) [Tetrahymena thermophila SB210]|uniref:Uncharacterized protein n=1 Tax=Tetrahymena thermophila (strain SB210) TaxID=312017 RepID=W7XIH4_TETTS|nr:hypothetical protein TTHERM_001328931 [Tetrahymena thermophila SB210]EWS74651.1 hypothetical protein TTHERM_001328931 [Tetrahymena thermophila SB210]|eukprot:XP_012652812.1 hypothetical protein TTHERM_001328931 [Tetrahymena thermophila SB210]